MDTADHLVAHNCSNFFQKLIHRQITQCSRDALTACHVHFILLTVQIWNINY